MVGRSARIVGWVLLMSGPAPATLAGTPIHDAELIFDPVLVIGQMAEVPLQLRAVRSWTDLPSMDGHSTIALLREGQRLVVFDGRVFKGSVEGIRFQVPEVAPGRWRLEVATRSPLGMQTNAHAVTLKERRKLHLAFDSTVHRPGELIRWRATLLHGGDRRPHAGVAMHVRLGRSSDAPLVDQVFVTDAEGAVSGRSRLPVKAAEGSYNLNVKVGTVRAQAYVRVQAAYRIRRSPPRVAALSKVVSHVLRSRGAPGVTVVTVDTEGALVPADLTRASAGKTSHVQSEGVQNLPWPSRGPRPKISSVVADGRVADTRNIARSWRGDRHRLALKSRVYTPGTAVSVPCEASPGLQVASILRDGAVITSAQCRDGQTSVQLRPPSGVVGHLMVRTTLSPRRKGVQGARDRRRSASIFVAPRPLSPVVGLSHPQGHGPTVLTVLVANPNGQPVRDANVQVRVVDVRLDEVAGPQTSLVETVLADTPVLKLRSRNQGLESLFRALTVTKGVRSAMEAVLSTLDRPASQKGWGAIVPQATRWQTEVGRSNEIFEVLVAQSLRKPGGLSTPLGAAALLMKGGWTEARSLTPWRDPLTLPYLQELKPFLTRERLARRVTQWRLDRLVARIRGNLAASRRYFLTRQQTGLGRYMGGAVYLKTDAWGRRFTVERLDRGDDSDITIRSTGPDGAVHTGDDLAATAVLARRVIGSGGMSMGSTAGAS